MRFVPLLILLAMLSACGQKGPLFLPESAAIEPAAPAPAAEAAPDPVEATDTDGNEPGQKRNPRDE